MSKRNSNEKYKISNFSILIVEDDLSFAIELNMLIDEIGYRVVGRVDNATKALETINKTPPDLILMDIHIKGTLTGIELAEKIKDTQIPILFISSIEQEEVYQKARTTNFVGYLVKPVSKFSIRTAVELAIKQISTDYQGGKSEVYTNQQYLFFKKKGIFKKVKIADICYIKADGDQTITYLKNERYTSFQSLNSFETLLKINDFIKVHRSYLVNLHQATSIDTDKQLISFGSETLPVPFSRRMKGNLIQYLKSM